MSAPRLLDRDPGTGTERWFHFDDDTGDFRIETRQDITELVAANKASYNSQRRRDRMQAKGTENALGTRMASIPMQVIAQLVQKGILNWSYEIVDLKRYKAWLNDAENVHFRTRPGRI